jgi:hypothetical protein
VDGERTHWTESRRRDLDVKGVSGWAKHSLDGDIVFLAGRVGVADGSRVPFMLARARGSIDLRRR